MVFFSGNNSPATIRNIGKTSKNQDFYFILFLVVPIAPKSWLARANHLQHRTHPHTPMISEQRCNANAQGQAFHVLWLASHMAPSPSPHKKKRKFVDQKSPALANATINQNYTRKEQYSAQENKGVEERWGGPGMKMGSKPTHVKILIQYFQLTFKTDARGNIAKY